MESSSDKTPNNESREQPCGLKYYLMKATLSFF
uniref:Uncharacterized protein n=1 Tax=Arundo donax TaxID=35708 RepID=A0A0A8Y7A7_ARUDO